MTRLCDYPGCDEPAVHIEQADAPNTGPKVWYSCEAHRPTPLALMERNATTTFPRSHLRIVTPTPAPYDWEQDPELSTHGPTPLERQGWPHDVDPHDILDALMDIVTEKEE